MLDDKQAQCPRNLALYRPGVPLPGVFHRYQWRGAIPLTGRLVCSLCGHVRKELTK